MKKASFTFTSIVIILLLVISCDRKVKTLNNEISFDTIQFNQTHYLGNDTSKPSCNLKISFVYPKSYTDKNKLQSLQAVFTEKILSEKFANFSPKEAVDEYYVQFLKEFNNFTEDDFTNEDEELKDESGYAYYTELKNEILYNQNNFISFTVSSEIYEGGAHGSHSVYGYVIDLSTGEFLSEDAIAGNNYKKNLATILAQKIALANGLTDVSQLENIGYNNISDIAPNNNFTIDDKGITYYFNEYEIGAYFIGITKVFIPYAELKIYLSKDNPISSLTGA